jgi:hypothetical protein
MAFMNNLSTIFGKKNDYLAEYKRFKSSIARNPRDSVLKAQFINFCLLNRFTGQETVEEHITEALELFETIDQREAFNLQCLYLVGKYYQEEKDIRKAYKIYLDAIKHFNRHVGKNPNLKAENADLAYSIALNLMTLQSNPSDPDLTLCFTILRKSYPLHLKSIEFENEMAKPAPDAARLKQLKEEIIKLKEKEAADSAPAPKEKAPLPVITKLEKKAVLETPQPQILTVPAPEPAKEQAPVVKDKPVPAEKVSPVVAKKSPVIDPQPVTKKLSETVKTEVKSASKELTTKKKKESPGIELSPGDGENLDFLKFSPTFEKTTTDTFFMVFKDNSWEGPYTPLQLSSKGFLKPGTWVCRSGSEHVTQAYEVPELLMLFK